MVDLSAKDAMAKVQINEIRMREIEKQVRQLISTLEQLNVTRTSLQNLPDEEKPSFVPVGSGLYLPTTLEKSTVCIDIGAGVVVEKKSDEAVELLDNREKQLKEAQAELAKANKAKKEAQVETEVAKMNATKEAPKIDKVELDDDGNPITLDSVTKTPKKSSRKTTKK